MTDITLNYKGGPMTLHKPYWSGATGHLSFSYNNLTFRSGDYTSYIDEIEDEYITLTGYENNLAMAKFNALNILADTNTEITIANMNGSWIGTYILQHLTYKPIGLDVVEYQMTLKFVK